MSDLTARDAALVRHALAPLLARRTEFGQLLYDRLFGKRPVAGVGGSRDSSYSHCFWSYSSCSDSSASRLASSFCALVGIAMKME